MKRLIPSVILFFASIFAHTTLGQSGESVQANPQPGQEITDDKGFTMVYVPSGNLQIGSTSEAAAMLCEQLHPHRETEQACDPEVFDTYNLVTPLQDVQLNAFYIDKFEVSLEAYLVCFDAGVCSGIELEQEIQGRLIGVDLALDHPVVDITFFDAAVFCAWREGRLPTEAEWEYAARSPEGYIFPWGNEFDGTKVNFGDQFYVAGDRTWTDGYTELAPIDSFPAGASWVGAYNMAGNAAEWVNTRYPISVAPEVGPDTGIRVQKGGSYNSSPSGVAAWAHLIADGLQGRRDTGFRCVRTSNPNGDSSETSLSRR